VKLIGVLSFYNESPSWLSACIASMAGVCDHVVAVDGRYGRFPDDAAVSPPEQAEAIVETAVGARLPLTLHRPTEPFYGNEVEKRNLTIKLAAAIGEEMRDWLFICDADCYVVESSEFLKHDLERTEHHCASVLVEEHMDSASEGFNVDIAKQVSLPSNWRSPVTLLYRLLPKMAYQGTHYSLGGEVDGKHVWLWGHDHAETPADLRQGIVVKHRNVERPKRRQEQAAAYYAARDRLKLEQRPSR
jgi:hypothetical protein